MRLSVLKSTTTFIVAALIALAGCAGSTVTIPPDAAAPRQVLEAYLSALIVGDCDTARSLAMGTFIPGNGELCGELEVTAIGAIEGPAVPNDTQVTFSTTVTTRGGDDSMPDGTHVWFYTLGRAASGAWRLIGGGTGP